MRIQFKESSESEWATSTLGTCIAIRTKISTDVSLNYRKPLVFKKWNPTTQSLDTLGVGHLTPGRTPQVFENDQSGSDFASYDVHEAVWEEPKTYSMLTVNTPSLEEAFDLHYMVSIEPATTGGNTRGNLGNYSFGEIIHISATPDPGNLFSHWTGVEEENKFKEVLALSADINLYLKPYFIPVNAWEAPVAVGVITRDSIRFTSSSKTGLVYTIQNSLDLKVWNALFPPIHGTGSTLEWESAHNPEKPLQFYRLWVHPIVP